MADRLYVRQSNNLAFAFTYTRIRFVIFDFTSFFFLFSIQMVVIDLPVFVYCFILIIYVALQMKMYVEASCAASILGLFYLMALIVWLTVLGCYHQMKVSNFYVTIKKYT